MISSYSFFVTVSGVVVSTIFVVDVTVVSALVCVIFSTSIFCKAIDAGGDVEEVEEVVVEVEVDVEVLDGVVIVVALAANKDEDVIKNVEVS
jgi:hypothetical protein